MVNVLNQVTAYDEEYMDEWGKLNNLMYENGMTWGTVLEETQESHYEKEEWCQYVVLSLLEMKQSHYKRIQSLTQDLFSAIQESVDYFHSLTPKEKEQLLDELAFSKYQQRLILNGKRMDKFSYLCRFDLVYDETFDAFKCIEFNSATPMGLSESAISNTVINDYYKRQSPNRLEKGLVDMWDNIREELNIGTDTIYFSSLRNHEEDRLNVEFQMNHAGHHGDVQFIGLEDIHVTDDGLYDESGNKINYWYKLFPMEYWELEPSDISHRLEKLVTEQNVDMINPIDAFLVQNKSFYAWMWRLAHQNDSPLSKESIAIIKDYLLPTYLSTDEKKEKLHDYVVKPVFGREGNCVDIYNNDTLTFKDEVHDETKYYDDQTKVYQQYVEMPDVTVETWDGTYTGKWLIGTYILNGVPSGLYNRVGHLVTGSQSLFVPFTLKEDE